MKHLTQFSNIFLSVSLLLTACNNDQKSATAEELAKRQQELSEKKQELSDKLKIAEIDAETKRLEAELQKVNSTIDPTPPSYAYEGARGTINGSGVVMRQESSVKSDKIGAFNQGETVDVLETKNVNNDNEGILSKQITLYATDKNTNSPVELTLPKGKAVVLEGYDENQNKHQVSYQDPQKGKLFGLVSADAIETISYSTWYKVRRANKQEGWVLGKFLKTN
jgi:hypothetical protein